MRSDVLVVNSAMVPINRVCWKRALLMIWTNRARVVAEHPDRKVRSPSLTVFVPSVVQVSHGYRSKVRPLSKKNLFHRDRGKCAYCGTQLTVKTATIDHIVPRSRGGKTRWENVVLSCSKCNESKGDRTPREAGLPERGELYAPRLDDPRILSYEYGELADWLREEEFVSSSGG